MLQSDATLDNCGCWDCGWFGGCEEGGRGLGCLSQAVFLVLLMSFRALCISYNRVIVWRHCSECFVMIIFNCFGGGGVGCVMIESLLVHFCLFVCLKS
jgi:hypothetical protein